MGRVFNKNDDDFVVAPEGTTAAVLTVLAFLGRHESTWQGQPRTRELVGLGWELGERAEDGRALSVSEIMTDSLHEKSKFFARVLALTGGREPPAGFDLEKLLGRGAVVTVVHEVRDGKTWANVAAVGPLPRGMAPPVPSVAPIYFDVETGDPAALAGLPARFRRLAETTLGLAPAPAPHAASLAAQAPPPARVPPRPPPRPPAAPGLDDDIPW